MSDESTLFDLPGERPDELGDLADPEREDARLSTPPARISGSAEPLLSLVPAPAELDPTLAHVAEPSGSDGSDGSTRSDSGLAQVVDWFRSQPGMVDRFGMALRQSMDEVLDGQRTGRFDLDALEKTEKTYLGTKVEIVVRAAFDLARGRRMDYTVAGHDVDSKFTSLTSWSIPTEAMGHLCLLTSANDHKGTFNVGVVRITADGLNAGKNKDGKRTLSQAGRRRIVWLAQQASLPANLLLTLPRETVTAILRPRSGQQRINELLRRVQGILIERTTAITVARQADGLKRCRDARRHLAPDGIVVLGHQNQSPIIARALQLPVPSKGSFVSARLVPVPPGTTDRPMIVLGDSAYAIAEPGSPTHPAPPVRY